MITRKTRLASSLLLAMFLIVSVAAVPVAFAAGNSSATGGGTILEGNEKSTFVFNAIQKRNGTVSGHLIYHFRVADYSFRMALDCLNVTGNVAVMSGVITQVSDGAPSQVYVGQRGVFQAQDNGQGAGASPDLISNVQVNSTATCTQASLPTLYIPVDGNIQVR